MTVKNLKILIVLDEIEMLSKMKTSKNLFRSFFFFGFFPGPMSLPLITTIDHSGSYPQQANMSASMCGPTQHQVNPFKFQY